MMLERRQLVLVSHSFAPPSTFLSPILGMCTTLAHLLLLLLLLLPPPPTSTLAFNPHDPAAPLPTHASTSLSLSLSLSLPLPPSLFLSPLKTTAHKQNL